MKNTTVREHLKAHHATMEKHHQGMAADHSELSEAHGPKSEVGKIHASLAKRHEAAADHHAGMLEECDGMTGKAAGGVDLNKIIPDNVSGVLSTFPSITAIPRFGQRPMPNGEKPNVPVEFEKLVSVEDDL